MWVLARVDNGKTNKMVHVKIDSYKVNESSNLQYLDRPTMHQGKYTIRFSMMRNDKEYQCLAKNITLVKMEDEIAKKQSHETDRKRRRLDNQRQRIRKSTSATAIATATATVNELNSSNSSNSSNSLKETKEIKLRQKHLQKKEKQSWSSLPTDLLECIAEYLIPRCIVNLAQTCKVIHKSLVPLVDNLKSRDFLEIKFARIKQYKFDTTSNELKTDKLLQKTDMYLEATVYGKTQKNGWVPNAVESMEWIYTCRNNLMIAIHKYGLVFCYHISDHSNLQEKYTWERYFWLDNGLKMCTFNPKICFDVAMINKTFSARFHCVLVDGNLISITWIKKFLMGIDKTKCYVYNSKMFLYIIQEKPRETL